MSTESLAQPARTSTTDQDSILERIETELQRLRELRPHLEAKVTRAEHILTAHLSTPQSRVIRARVGAGGLQVLVRSLSMGSRGAVYSVDPKSWSCSCPDYHRSCGICKHAIAAWALSRATVRAECPPCRGDGRVWIGESTEDPDTGELTERITGLTCSRCGGSGRL